MMLTGRSTHPAPFSEPVPPPPPYPQMHTAVNTALLPHPLYRKPAASPPMPISSRAQVGASPLAIPQPSPCLVQQRQQQQQQQQQPPAPPQQRQQGQCRPSRPTSIFGGRFALLERLGSGGFGDVYRAEERDQPSSIAVKVEQVMDSNARPEQSFLFHEAKVLQEVYKCAQAYQAGLQQQRILQQQQQQQQLSAKANNPREANESAALAGTTPSKIGIAKLKYYGQDCMNRVLIMSLHGCSVESVHRQQGRLSLFATVMIADQVLTSLEYVHRAGYVHADLKPDNILFGREDPEQLYLVDFGLSVRFQDRKGKHRPLITNHSFVGTPRYASLRTHMGYTMSRRDDIEQLLYVMIYLFRGRLPWSGLRIDDPDAKEKRIAQMKAETPLDVICGGCPEAFCDVLNYARCMQFEEEPKYEYLHVLLGSLRDSCSAPEPREVPSCTAANALPTVQPHPQPPPQRKTFLSHVNYGARPHGKDMHGDNAAAIDEAGWELAAEEAGLAKNSNIVSGIADQVEGAMENPLFVSSPGTDAPALFSDAIGQGILSGNATDAGPLSPHIDCLNDEKYFPQLMDLHLPGSQVPPR